MRWQRGVGRGQLEDRRGGLGGGLVLPVGGGLGGIGILVALVALLLGGFNGGSSGPLDPFPGSPAAQPGNAPPEDARLYDFVGFVTKDVQDYWASAFAAADEQYRPTKTVVFSGSTATGCGAASAATGPFYCPADGRVYLDLSFFRELRDRFGAPGDFAQAYVIAHEYGHHVQDLLGISGDVSRRQRDDPANANELSIRLELQADCLAGVWAHSAYAQNQLEEGDLREGLRAAAAVGDDRIQKQATGRIDRESWTHGSSTQRVRWFRTGFDRGDVQACDTF